MERRKNTAVGIAGSLVVYGESTLGKVDITESREERQKEGKFLFIGARPCLTLDLTLDFQTPEPKYSFLSQLR